MNDFNQNRQITIRISLKYTLLALGVLAAAVAAVAVLRALAGENRGFPLVFMLAVLIVARFTDGLWYGIAAAVASALAIPVLATYPSVSLIRDLWSNLVALVCLIAAAVMTSKLTAESKRHSLLYLEAEKEKTRGNLLRAISHDLRTPLTAILGASSAIIENDAYLTPKERGALLAEVREEAQWLIRMVENLLSITRIDGEDAAKIAKAPEAVEELVGDVLGKFYKRFPDKPVTVKVPAELMMVPMDAVLIEQVLINLLENAALHAKTATQIELVVYNKGSVAVFEVSDNGAGIPPEALPRIFEGYFKQSYENESDKKRNMGIGLSVCQTIVKAHNGILTAQNKPAGGALFRFTLPMETVKFDDDIVIKDWTTA